MKLAHIQSSVISRVVLAGIVLAGVDITGGGLITSRVPRAGSISSDKGIGDSSGSGMRVDGICSSNTRINIVLAESISGVVVVGSVVSSVEMGGGSHYRLTGGSAHMHLLTIAHASLIPAIAVTISVGGIAVVAIAVSVGGITAAVAVAVSVARIAVSVSSISVATITSISVSISAITSPISSIAVTVAVAVVRSLNYSHQEADC